MTAKEAREKATSLENEKIYRQLKEIYAEIEKRVKQTRLEAYYYESVHNTVIAQLQNDGYTVSENNDSKDGYTLIIKW